VVPQGKAELRPDAWVLLSYLAVPLGSAGLKPSLVPEEPQAAKVLLCTCTRPTALAHLSSFPLFLLSSGFLPWGTHMYAKLN
jgi:hypothetical protein